MNNVITKPQSKNEMIDLCFSRMIGLVTREDLINLSNIRVAIGGCGGVGSFHALNLARMGVGNFNLADFDEFDYVNISRQGAAYFSTIGQNKAFALKNQILDINPFAEVNIFEAGVTKDNIHDFLENVDYYIDGIEFFEIDIRMLIFNTAWSNKIISLTSGPLGFGGSLLIFDPLKSTMSPEQFFDIKENMEYLEKLAKFAAAIAPKPLHLKDIDYNLLSILKRRGPAVCSSCTLSASLVSNAILQIVCKNKVNVIPNVLQIDLKRQKMLLIKLRYGNRGLFQKLICKIILKKFKQKYQLEILEEAKHGA
ncbi:MAG: thiamine biosynthesis protein ThiF [Burkholderiales bacterium]|nr:thiamine biosynthesis protein ThiF [Burkholderiales bacterium]